jgi:pescadillo protein
VSDEFKNTPEMLALTKKHDEMKRQRRLFSKCTFLFNREAPTYCLQYLVLSFGGTFFTQDGYDSLKTAAQPKITHHVLDRPLPQSQLASLKKEGNTELIQPQYLVDSLNNLHLLPTSQYVPGTPPPAHLSPFVDGQREGYMPQREKEILHLKGEEVLESDEEDDMLVEESENSKAAEDDKADKKQGQERRRGDADSSSDEEGAMDDDEVMMKGDMSAEEAQRLKARKQVANAKLKKELDQEQKELARTLMTNRQRKLYRKAEDEQKSKKVEIQKLKVKRKTIEKAKAKK